MNDEKEEKKEETAVNVPRETNPQENGETSSPKETPTKPVDTEPAGDDDSDLKAQVDGLAKKVDSAVDLLTSILNAVSNDGDSKEDDEPEKKDTQDNDNSVEDFENLL